MKIDEVPSLARKARIATHTHIKVRLAFDANGAENLGASAALTGLDWIGSTLVGSVTTRVGSVTTR